VAFSERNQVDVQVDVSEFIADVDRIATERG
jgi:hypothetical protein